MPMSNILRIGIMIPLMVYIYYYYYLVFNSIASSLNSSAPKITVSTINSSPSFNSSAPKINVSTSNSSNQTAPSFNSSVPKINVSTSTSSIQSSFKYDMFLSFRGEDISKNFVDHLYHALKDKGIYTYKDDENSADDPYKSIEDSKIYMIVFSKNYASSSWCLNELAKIMEYQKMPGHTAYPIFYDVEPTEVRKQTGAFGEAFSKSKQGLAYQLSGGDSGWAEEHGISGEALERWRNSLEELGRLHSRGASSLGFSARWREALKEAADLVGWELKNTLDGHEAKFIDKIVRHISLELRPINSSIDENLVGMETRVRNVISSLEFGIDEVRMIGIKGMGGTGKTTTARAVFDLTSYDDFEVKSFVANVTEASKDPIGLKKLQEQVIFQVLNERVTLDSVYDGKEMMKRRLCGKKILLVLDDVDGIEQLEALAGDPKWFKPGSRIIITTRDVEVLKLHKVNVTLDIDLLSDEEAISLFSRYAFGKDMPAQGYEQLSQQVVRYASGLPLTVRVLGSFLFGKDKLEWVDTIDRLEEIPEKETLENLELSYTSLEYEYQEIFKDIACILKGYLKEDAIKILTSSGFLAGNGLKVLEQRSLITIDACEILGMHDLIEEMGKNIVRRSHPDEPNKHSHLWINEEIEDILANDMGTEETRSLKLDMSKGSSKIVMKGLGKMKKLRYLEVYFADYDKWESDGQLDIPNSLKYLKFERYPFLHLPETFQANNLVGLDIYDSRRMVQLWKEGEKKNLKKLKFLSLSRSALTTFDFKITPNLQTLSIDILLEGLYFEPHLVDCDNFVNLQEVSLACRDGEYKVRVNPRYTSNMPDYIHTMIWQLTKKEDNMIPYDWTSTRSRPGRPLCGVHL